MAALPTLSPIHQQIPLPAQIYHSQAWLSVLVWIAECVPEQGKPILDLLHKMNSKGIDWNSEDIDWTGVDEPKLKRAMAEFPIDLNCWLHQVIFKIEEYHRTRDCENLKADKASDKCYKNITSISKILNAVAVPPTFPLKAVPIKLDHRCISLTALSQAVRDSSKRPRTLSSDACENVCSHLLGKFVSVPCLQTRPH
ncbi:hypothetical protein EJ06DRAFT_239124 [Trichodelitschia bisporula]|uniref:Uncharacterized protein n=1 Tax=Trichodelitschia bisporula TaxID=703511 RepID=A0A6G1HKJ5_9PEZI|nr:hypothetical protein EJ06DRAFT_239124 [Trichodelitschia bisporula]